MSATYYNENDAFAAEWLRKLILFGLIAPGEVDERSIEDVKPDDLRGYEQCHFFAGIGVWSYALRCAGWEDDRPIWTGSCPCQPFSAAGQRGGIADERHLWPAWHHLIRQRRPSAVAGEQVASKDGMAWLDIVSADMEGSGYAFGAADLCAAGFGAPHIRQRNFFAAIAVADDESSAGGTGLRNLGSASGGLSVIGDSGAVCRVDDDDARSQRHAWNDGAKGGRQESQRSASAPSLSRGVGDAEHLRCDEGIAGNARAAESARSECRAELDRSGTIRIERPCPTNGFWRDADWLFCRDGKWRPVESGTFPLVNGLAGRVGLLRGFGNAIVAPVATGFIEAVMDCMP